MAKKKSKNNNHGSNNNSNKTDNNNKIDGGAGGGDGDNNSRKDDYTTTVVMKIEMHCEGCASKITKIARAFQGVESAKAETDSNKLTVMGKVDPLQIQQSLHQKTKKKVDLISPQLKKQDPNKSNKDDQKSTTDKAKPPPSNKPKEAPVTTAVLKLGFHCQGCTDKIRKIVSKTKGVHEMAMDELKETVTVKGTMDVNALTEVLIERLKRPVLIVPPKKEKEGGAKDGGNDGGGDGGKKSNGGGGGGGGEPAKMEGNRMDFMAQPGFGPGYGYMGQPVYGNGYLGQPVLANGYMGPPVFGYGPEYGYGYGYGGPVAGYPAHMQFNDENPNACSIM